MPKEEKTKTPEGYKLLDDKKHFHLAHDKYGSTPKKIPKASH